MPDWFPEPETRDDTYGRPGEGTVSWLARSTVPRAVGYRTFLNRNLSMLPAGCRKDKYHLLRAERHHQDGLFELVVGRTLQELGAEIECEPEGLQSGKRPDFVSSFADGKVYVEAVRPVMDREIGSALGQEVLVTELVEESVPPGWAADIRALPRVGPGEPRRHIKAFLRREMALPPPAHPEEEVTIEKAFEQGDLKIILFPQARVGLSSGTKIALRNAVSFFADDRTPLLKAVRRKYKQLARLDGPALVALNMTSATSGRDDLDRALFGVTVSRWDQHSDEVERYFKANGLFAGGHGDPTVSGVLAFPNVGILRCADPALWVHPRFRGTLPRALEELEIRRAPTTGPEVSVRNARRVGVLDNLGFLAK